MRMNESELRSEFLIQVPDVPQESGVAVFNGKAIETIGAIVRTEHELVTIVDDNPDACFSELATQAGKLRADLHGHHRSLVQHAVERQQILESIEGPLRKNLLATVTELEKTRARIGKALEKAGLGLQNMPSAAVNPPAALIQFNHHVEGSSDVKQARAVADQAHLAVSMLDTALRHCIDVELRQRQRLKAVARSLLMI